MQYNSDNEIIVSSDEESENKEVTTFIDLTRDEPPPLLKSKVFN
jgi:hypothetical protein